MFHQMAKFVDGFAWLLWPLRQYHSAVAKGSLLFLILFGGLEYGYKVHGKDLLWWRSKLSPSNINPLYILLFIAVGKVSVILALALVSCIRSAVVKKDPKLEIMPITCVRRRYCRFLVMQLLASLDELVLEPETMDLADYYQRHETFITAVQRFRCQARKMFERTDRHLYRPQDVVLPVNDQMEELLLRRGYADGIGTLREWEIYRMLYNTPRQYGDRGLYILEEL